MRNSELREALAEIGLRLPPYWKPEYLKNIQNLSKPLYGVREERNIPIEEKPQPQKPKGFL